MDFNPFTFHYGLVLICFLSLSIASADDKSKNGSQCAGLVTSGYTSPAGDIAVRYGDPLEIYCVINNETYLQNNSRPSQYLHFIKDGKKVPKKAIQIVNNTSIKLYQENVEKTHSIYTCLLNSDAICLNKVSVGVPPQNVTDFRCISQNYENLTCTWTPPDNFVKTNYSLTFKLPGRAGGRLTNICGVFKEYLEPRRMRCFWNITTDPHYRQSQPTFLFNMKMNNTFGENELNYTFEHHQYVKAAPPQNLTHNEVTTNSIELHWRIPSTLTSFVSFVQYRVMYQCEHGPKKWELAVLGRSNSSSTSVFYTLPALKPPHAVCDIRVALKTDKAVGEEMWSSNSSIFVRLKSAVPSMPPRVNIGSFQLNRNTFKNDVYIYWQQIPEEEKNGEEFIYTVIPLNNETGELRRTELTNAYAKFENLFTDQTYEFIIYSTNSEGNSTRYSRITVPATRPPEPISFTKADDLNGTYRLSWQPPKQNQSEIKNYTIFWCSHAKDRPYQCDGFLDWTEVSNKTSYEIEMENKNKTWQFAIATNLEHSSSGMLWAACTILKGSRFGKISTVTRVFINSTTIQLTWKLDCIDASTNIIAWMIKYCQIVSPKEQKCKGEELTSEIKGNIDLHEGYVTGLQPYKTYTLSVAFKTLNQESEFSDPIFETTLEGAPSPPRNLQILGVTNSSIKISWDKPSEPNGALKYYSVQLNDSTVKVDEYNNLTYTWTNLTSYVNYYVSVRACTTECSNMSGQLVKTKMGTPGVMSAPKVSFHNSSYFTVTWSPPELPNGPTNYYEIHKRKSINDPNPEKENVTDNEFRVISCGGDNNMQTSYVSVRAVNINETDYYFGPWSDDLEFVCTNPQNLILWVICIVAVLGLCFGGVFVKKMHSHVKDMKNVDLKLPPGLDAIPEWVTTKRLEEPERHISAAADEELLLEKINESQLPSGDSSGCSSGHSSVVSESGTTFSGGSDSGTEQTQLRKRTPRTSAAGNMRPVAANAGYVPMPGDGTRTKPPSNYCVLGVDPNDPPTADRPYVTVALKDTPKMQYIACEPMTNVLPNDNKPSVSGYVPLNYPDMPEKSPPYVMAGADNINHINPEPNKVVAKPIGSPYVQVADAAKLSTWQPQPIEHPAKGYMSIGDALSINKRQNPN